MLDPKAKWPKAKEHSFGLRLIAVAKKCSAEEYRERPPAKDVRLFLPAKLCCIGILSLDC